MSRETGFPHQIPVLEKAGMSLLCLFFVRTFIGAHRLSSLNPG